MPTEQDTPTRVPTPRSTGRALALLRLVTLACAAVMAFSPNSYDHYHAALLAGIAFYRP